MLAIDRFYRSYAQHCKSHNADTLFQLLSSLHSLNDQLKVQHKIDFFDIPEFITLKVIRNYLHHAGDISDKIVFANFTDLEISTDLMHLCLFEAKQLDQAISGIIKKYRDEHEKTTKNTVHYYGNYVNIAPAIFNVAAAVMVVLLENEIEGDSDEFHEVKAAVKNDINIGCSIRVSGKISGHPGDLNKLVNQIYEKFKYHSA